MEDISFALSYNWEDADVSKISNYMFLSDLASIHRIIHEHFQAELKKSPIRLGVYTTCELEWLGECDE